MTWWNELAKLYVKPIKQLLGMDMTPQQLIDQLLPSLLDPTGEKLIAQMKNAGIDMTVACALDYGLALGDPKVSIEEQNQIFAGIQKKYPKKILAFASVDPRRPNADKLIRRCFEEWKMSGLKLHPASGFYPNSKEVYKLLDIAREFKKPVLFHTGQIVQPLRSKYCAPMFLDDVCLDFPELWIQAAHMGFGWRYELYHMGSCKMNLTVDFSGWQQIAKNNYHEFCASLRECLDEFTPERVLWGTDGPLLEVVMSSKDYIQIIKDLPVKATEEGIKFTQEEVDLMLGGSAQKIFGVK
jgi:predicted TIM-barrel fold metal-dependent hydrolase